MNKRLLTTIIGLSLACGAPLACADVNVKVMKTSVSIPQTKTVAPKT